MKSSRPYLIRAIYEWVVDNGCTPYLVADAGSEGVQVPSAAVQDDQVVLNIIMTATQALELGNDFIEFHARFGGVAHAVSLPVGSIRAIYARENGEGISFGPEGPEDPSPGDGPDGGETPPGDTPDRPKNVPAKGPALKLVK